MSRHVGEMTLPLLIREPTGNSHGRTDVGLIPGLLLAPQKEQPPSLLAPIVEYELPGCIGWKLYNPCCHLIESLRAGHSHQRKSEIFPRSRESRLRVLVPEPKR